MSGFVWLAEGVLAGDLLLTPMLKSAEDPVELAEVTLKKLLT
jgi:hypothetical protein